MTHLRSRQTRRRHGSRGVSTALGTMLFVVVALSIISSLALVLTDEAKQTQVSALVESALNERSKELLFAYGIPNGTDNRIEVLNNGSVSSQIVSIFFVNESSGQLSLCSLPVCSITPTLPAVISPASGGLFILSGTPSGSPTPATKIGLITSLGHTLWISSGLPPNTIQFYTLTMIANPSADGTTGPSSGTYYFPAGVQVTISACPAQGHSFAGWSGIGSGSYSGIGQGSCTGNGNQLRNSATITLNGNITETAYFA